ncbi:MAG: hypothetical protein HUJ58_07325, partial [Erysipelotrichaceae bacterium]|nr:hypothetical protein [Erysipelotrichaceae bacterium]
LKEACKLPVELTDLEHLGTYELPIVFIGGGGTEGRFRAVFDKLPKPVILLSTGFNNSLAASLEILSFLRQNNVKGEVLHGSVEYVAKRIQSLHQTFKAVNRVHNLKIGRVGAPSDWLISSDVDNETSKKQNGIEIVDVTMEEFFEEIAKKTYVPNEYTEAIVAKNFHPEDTELCLQIYGALRRIVDKYHLDGVTVRCFDLLDTVKGTSCLALAILNAEGIYAGCEGDTPSLISMAVIGEITGKDVFMCNPSRILTDESKIVLAHCTLPITMPKSFSCDTHFESGLGVAINGRFDNQPVTIFKCSGLLDRHFATDADIIDNRSERSLCRTQLEIQMGPDDVQYFLTNSIGNHHMVVLGHHKDDVDEFFKWF